MKNPALKKNVFYDKAAFIYRSPKIENIYIGLFQNSVNSMTEYVSLTR